MKQALEWQTLYNLSCNKKLFQRNGIFIMNNLQTLNEIKFSIENASTQIYTHLHPTLLEYSFPISQFFGVHVYLKQEHHNPTGSFKVRGALSKLLSLPTVNKVICASTGNHGLAVAWASRKLHKKVTIYLPKYVISSSVEKMKALDAELVFVEGDCSHAEIEARSQANISGIPYISPYNDHLVIAGQGTIAKELIHELPDMDAVFIAVGGGGLVSGIGAYLKSIAPRVKVIGCWPENAATLYHSIKARKIVLVKEEPTISVATAGGLEPDSITFPIAQSVIDEMILVTEHEIQEAIKQMAIAERIIIEGAAGVALASMIKSAPAYQGKKVAVIVCGRNIDWNLYRSIIN